MILWGGVAKLAIVAGIVGGGIWWISQGRYDSGYRAGGEKVSESVKKEVTDRMTALHKAEMEELRRGYAEQLAINEKINREKIETLAAQSLANQLRFAEAEQATRAGTSDLERELRDTRSQREIRHANSCPRLPQASGGGVPAPVSDGLLSQRAEGNLARLIGDARKANDRYAWCLSEYYNAVGKPLKSSVQSGQPTGEVK